MNNQTTNEKSADENEQLKIFSEIFCNQIDATDKDNWNLVFGAFCIGWQEREAKSQTEIERLKSENERLRGEWKLIESEDDLPRDKENYLWQFKAGDIRKPSEYFIGFLLQSAGQVVSGIGSYAFGVDRLAAWRELPEPAQLQLPASYAGEEKKR